MTLRRGVLRAARRVIALRARRHAERQLRRADIIDAEFYSALIHAERRLSTSAVARHFVSHGRFTRMTVNPLIDPDTIITGPGTDTLPSLLRYLDGPDWARPVSAVWDSERFAQGPWTGPNPIAAAWRAARAEGWLPLRDGDRTVSIAGEEVYRALSDGFLRAAPDRPLREATGPLHAVVVARRHSPYVERLLVRLESLAAEPDIDVTLVLVDPTPGELSKAALSAHAQSRLRWAAVPREMTTAEAATLGMAAARATTTALVDGAYDATAAELRHLLLTAAAAPSRAVMPLGLAPDGTVRHAGAHVSASGRTHELLRGLVADDARALGTLVSVPYLSGPNIAAPTAMLSTALTSAPAGTAALAHSLHAQGAEGLLDTSRPWRRPVLDVEADAPGGEPDPGDADALADFYAPLALRPEGRGGFRSTSARTSPRLRWALKTSAPSARDLAPAWGDVYFAEALARSLRELGQHVVVDSRDSAERSTADADDVVVAIRGLHAYRPVAGVTALLWIISHPDLVTAEEIDAYDTVFAASASWCQDVHRAVGWEVRPLLQATDSRLFRPGGHPRTEPALFVGNSRDIARPIVQAAATTLPGMRVFGGGWAGRLPAGVLAGRSIANHELPEMYERASVVINDHWEDMRRAGFISNRVFDVVAAGGRVLSDRVEGIDEVFEGAVVTVDAPDDVATLAEVHIDGLFPTEEALRDISDRIRREHSFDRRAEELLREARRLRAG